MRNYDLLFLDMDGTLLKDDHQTISERNRAALKAAQEAGVKLVVASGRCLGILPDFIESIGFDYALTSNGASVTDLKTGREICRADFPLDAARLAVDVAKKAGCDFIEFFAYGKILLSKESFEKAKTRPMPIWHKKHLEAGGTPVVESDEAYLAAGAPGLEKINLVRYEHPVIQQVWEKLNPTGMYSLTGSIAKSIEINAKNGTKGQGIAAMCRALGVDIARTAAMGDASNDLDMMQTAGCGVAMGNATDEVKALADRVTASNEDDGVAEFVENFILK